ncbi:hypothetical protein B296_00056076 [Ensete ventricosum]|uniref:Uncharacterized protein n=1 Tax=Ensete ventricosum TaxID=4639 RepID=A0A426XRA0_ENSVE|nr:hypothetical protein B296_00056076 [Ensete ventricosum]
MRRRLIFPRWDEGKVSSCLSARGRGCCLVFQRGDEAAPIRTLEDEGSPRLPARGRRAALSSHAGTRQRLVLPPEDEASPRLPT